MIEKLHPLAVQCGTCGCPGRHKADKCGRLIANSYGAHCECKAFVPQRLYGTHENCEHVGGDPYRAQLCNGSVTPRTPQPCDPDVFKDGSLVLVIGGVPSLQIEEWVKLIARMSDQRVDWHFAGGRAQVLAIGDVGLVRECIHLYRDQLPENAVLG